MAQGIFGGATSYEEQSLQDILDDIVGWIQYTTDNKSFILSQKSIVEKSGFWDKIAFDFQLTILSTISYFDTIIFDLNIIKTAFTGNRITEKEVKLLRNIGVKAISYNHEYGRTFREDKRDWHDYGNPDFREVEEIYGRGRDYFVTMQDASNAAARLEDYMEKGQVINNTLSIQGSVSGSQIQQGTTNSTQAMDVVNAFDYAQVLDVINKIKRSTQSEDFDIDFGEKSVEVKQIIDDTLSMIETKEEPTKIKKMLSTLKDLAIGVSSSLIASGICGLITQLPIW